MIVDFIVLTVNLSLGCVFSPHHVNQGGVQKATLQVTLYKPHTAKESLRKHGAGRNSQVLPGRMVRQYLTVPAMRPGST